eukprot:6075646-Amphidinium_carterae.1
MDFTDVSSEKDVSQQRFHVRALLCSDQKFKAGLLHVFHFQPEKYYASIIHEGADGSLPEIATKPSQASADIGSDMDGDDHDDAD